MIQRIRRSDVLLHGMLVFGGLLVAGIFNYLFYMLIGRRAGVVVYGEVTSLASALLVLGAPANVAQLIAARLAAGLDHARDAAALKRLGNLVTLWATGCGLVAVAVAAAFQAPIAAFFKLSDGGSVVAASIGLAGYWVAYTQRGVFQGAHKFEDFSASIALESLVKVVAGVGLVASFGTTGALAGFALGLIVSALYNTARFRMLFGSATASLPYGAAAIRRVVSGVGLGQITLTVLIFYDVPLVKHAFEPHAAGLYAAAALVGRAVVAACAFVPTILLPKATARAAAGRSPLPLLGAALGLAVAIVAVAAAVSAFAPAFVVTTIAGRAFAAASPLVLPYVAASGALSLATVVAAYNFGLHRYDFVVPTAVVASAEIVTLTLWHPTPSAVVTVLLVGHTCVLAATLFRVWRAVRPEDAAEDMEPLVSGEREAHA